MRSSTVEQIMGFSQSWIAVNKDDCSYLLELMQLRKTAEFSECVENGANCIDMGNGWNVLIEEHVSGTPVFEREDVIVPLSRRNELIVAFVEEHTMFSTCAAWRDGKQIWRLEHDAQKGLSHLVIEGQMPECFESIRAENLKLQEGISDTDFVFEIPLAVGERMCGYKHDQTPDVASQQPFEKLRPNAAKPNSADSSSFKRFTSNKEKKPETLADMIRSFFKPKS